MSSEDLHSSLREIHHARLPALRWVQLALVVGSTTNVEATADEIDVVPLESAQLAEPEPP